MFKFQWRAVFLIFNGLNQPTPVHSVPPRSEFQTASDGEKKNSTKKVSSVPCKFCFQVKPIVIFRGHLTFFSCKIIGVLKILSHFETLRRNKEYEKSRSDTKISLLNPKVSLSQLGS